MDRYRIVEPHIIISTPSFRKDAFFGSKTGVKVKLGENFRGMVFPEIELDVPVSNGLIIMSRDLGEHVIDAENIAEIGEEGILTPNEWTQILFSCLLLKGEGDSFKADFPNLSYLRLGGGEVFAVYAFLGLAGVLWHLGANHFDDRRRKNTESRLFSRSSQ